jgi:hypothetical protein
MRAIMDHRDERERKLTGHPLFAWLRDSEVPLGNRMDILPVSAPLPTMFRDLNMWVLRYPAPASPLQDAINAHTIEDATHSQLYVDDWRALGFDERLGFSAADTLWWLFASAPAWRCGRAARPARWFRRAAGPGRPLRRRRPGRASPNNAGISVAMPRLVISAASTGALERILVSAPPSQAGTSRIRDSSHPADVIVMTAP